MRFQSYSEDEFSCLEERIIVPFALHSNENGFLRSLYLPSELQAYEESA
jgi:hypothetical protein